MENKNNNNINNNNNNNNNNDDNNNNNNNKGNNNINNNNEIQSFPKQSPRGLFKKTYCKNFAKFTKKHQCRTLFLDRVAG